MDCMVVFKFRIVFSRWSANDVLMDCMVIFFKFRIVFSDGLLMRFL